MLTRSQRTAGLALSLVLSLAAACGRDRAEEAPVSKDPAESTPPGTDLDRKGLRDNAEGGGESGRSRSAPNANEGGAPGAAADPTPGVVGDTKVPGAAGIDAGSGDAGVRDAAAAAR
jgi:hypothetical protein